MSASNRCADCLDVLDDGPRYEVLRKVREMPADAHPIDVELLHGLLFDSVPLCRSCAGWYRDAVEIET